MKIINCISTSVTSGFKLKKKIKKKLEIQNVTVSLLAEDDKHVEQTFSQNPKALPSSCFVCIQSNRHKLLLGKVLLQGVVNVIFPSPILGFIYLYSKTEQASLVDNLLYQGSFPNALITQTSLGH